MVYLFVIDRIADRLFLSVDGLSEDAAMFSPANPILDKLYHEERSIAVCIDSQGAPVHIADGEVRYALLEKPDISGIVFPKTSPLSAAYRVESTEG